MSKYEHKPKKTTGLTKQNETTHDAKPTGHSHDTEYDHESTLIKETKSYPRGIPQTRLQPSMLDEEEKERLIELRDVHQKNLHVYELQYAAFGELHAPPYVVNSIRDLKKKIEEIDNQLDFKRKKGKIAGIDNSYRGPTETLVIKLDLPMSRDKEALTKIAIRAFAAVLDIDPDHVVIHSIERGSIVVEITIPKEAAERLRQMYHDQDELLQAMKVVDIKTVAKQDKAAEQLLKNLLDKKPEK